MRINIKQMAFFVQVLSLLLIGYYLKTFGFDSLRENTLWIAYSVVLVLTLPSLIAKGFFGAPFVSFTSAMSYLYYPLSYIVLYGLSHLFGLSFATLSAIFGLFTIFYWNYLLMFLLFKLKKDYIGSLSRNGLFALIPIFIFLLFVGLLIRQPGSVLATDYIQHQTVSNVINEGEKFCIIPNDCSNLFLQVGYTTFYHFILGTIGIFNGNDLVKVLYILDFSWSVVIGIAIYKLAISRLNSRVYSSIAVLASLLIFINGAYDTSFFLPQTLSLLLFLHIISSKKLNFIKTVLAAMLLIASHFVIGTYLSVILFIYYVLIYLFLDSQKTLKMQRLILLISLVITIFFFLLHTLGFSFENNFQRESLKVIGDY
ncbi:hypothetical protein KC669_04895, partial [Candidatus Dojkabacteria bacterium]|nr:hypothetical protein [Candidatus Dojkabacteria bacterium]